MPVGPLAVLDETSLVALGPRARPDARRLAAEGRPTSPSPASCWSRRWSRSSAAPAAPPAAASTTIRRARRSASGRAWRRTSPRPASTPTSRTLKQRLLYRQSIETARCLAEGVLTSVAEANIGSIFGIGFPAWTGGAMQFIASEGKERFLANAAALAATPRRALRGLRRTRSTPR